MKGTARVGRIVPVSTIVQEKILVQCISRLRRILSEEMVQEKREC